MWCHSQQEPHLEPIDVNGNTLPQWAVDQKYARETELEILLTVSYSVCCMVLQKINTFTQPKYLMFNLKNII